jgi:putative cardiolipin synthase
MSRWYRSAGSSLTLSALLAGCATITPPIPESESAIAAELSHAKTTSVFGPADDFRGSTLKDVGNSEIYPVRSPQQCEVAVIPSGQDSFAVRMDLLEAARSSIRIQALVFSGDEAGLRIAEILKRKKAEGVDVRVIVDAFSNPALQTQWMYFDLKQHGIEVEGYEALALHWINEIPVPFLTPHFDSGRMDKRFHEKLWLIDSETPTAMAVTGGLNIANEYFQVDDRNPDDFWRDQDIAVRGAVLEDLTTAFDRTFDYLVGIKESRGVFNTNLYWDATRHVMASTGKMPVSYHTDPRLLKRLAQLEGREPDLRFREARCRFLHNRTRFGENYILQAYLKLFAHARKEILVANAYFVPTPVIMAALSDAASRCVAVTILTNSPETNDLPEITMVGRGYYRDILAINETAAVANCPNRDAGIRIFEWTGDAPDDPVKQGTMHSKFVVVDRRLALVGSYNLDPRSERLNSETGLVFENPESAGELARLVLDQDLHYSRKVTVEDAENFAEPDEVIYRFRKELGSLFEDEL